MFRQPLHKRVISRVIFYGGVVLYLWLMDHSQGAECQAAAASREAPVTHPG